MMPEEDYTELMIMPHSVKAEEAMIGAAFVNPECIRQVALTSGNFYLSRNKIIWDAIQTVANAKKEINSITVTEELEKRGLLEEAGGLLYIIDVTQACPSALQFQGFADIILEMSIRRDVIFETSKLATAAYDKKSDLNKAISEVISNLVMRSNVKSGAVHIKQAVSEFYDKVDSRYKNPIPHGQVSGISTGFIDFDEATDGLQTGEEMLLSAVPGLGKSLFAFQIASNAANNEPGAVYELEMSLSNLIGRQISGMAKVTTRAMRRGYIQDTDWPNIVSAIEAMSLKPIYLSDDTQWTILKLRSDLARLKETAGIKWFVLDYLGLLKDQYGKNETERTTYLSSQIHDICKDLKLAGLVIQSMNKSGMRENNGDMTSLGGAAGLISDADQIIFMSQDETTANLYHLKWAKMRNDIMPGIVDLVKVNGFPAYVDRARLP
jgi:replicative DNA helicase